MSKQQSTLAKSSASQDAITLLIEDHKLVQKLFKDFDKIREQDDDDGKLDLVGKICTELTIHTQIEEEIFYPAARDALDEDDLFDEAAVEHTSAKELISQLEAMEPYDEFYDAKVTVLGEYINHHVKEEQDEMFPKVKKSSLDLRALGAEMLARKEEIRSELGLDNADEEDDEDAAPTRSTRHGEKRTSPGART